MSNSSVLIHTCINPNNRDYFSSKDRVKRYEKKCFGSKNGDLSDRHGELNERHGVLKFKIIRAKSPWDKTPQFSILLTSGVLSHIDCISRILKCWYRMSFWKKRLPSCTWCLFLHNGYGCYFHNLKPSWGCADGYSESEAIADWGEDGAEDENGEFWLLITSDC